jgi:uncharacterized membrane protein
MVMPAHPPDTVSAYLAQLRRALKGAPAGLISDALADCEDHLNNEIAQNPELTETQILASVVETYGTPEEIAEEYRDMEHSISTPFPQPEAREERRFGFFNVVSDPRTYGALLYMLLSLATGIFYFTWAVTGLSLTIGFAILIIGIPFALLFIASVRVLSHVEGRIVEALLGVRMPRRLPAEFATDEGLWTKIKEAFSDVRTWSSLFYMLLMLPLGVTYFVLGVVGLSLSLGVVGGSIFSLITGESHIQIDQAPYLEHILHTAPGLVLLALAGILLFFVVLHAARAIGWVHGKIAEGLLVRL